MQKKGIVYRATMGVGLAIVGVQLGYEFFYWKNIKKDRDGEIKEVRWS